MLDGCFVTINTAVRTRSLFFARSGLLDSPKNGVKLAS